MARSTSIYTDLLNLLINNIYINTEFQEYKKEKLEEKFFDDDYEDKRKYRLFTIKQKEYCWNRVNLFIIK